MLKDNLGNVAMHGSRSYRILYALYARDFGVLCAMVIGSLRWWRRRARAIIIYLVWYIYKNMWVGGRVAAKSLVIIVGS